MPRSWRVIEGGNTGAAKKSTATLIVIDPVLHPYMNVNILMEQWLEKAISAFKEEHDIVEKA